ncbi:MAG: hypothetical protein FWG43_01490 [Clostridiales bacterium]|nr:hypothetical protein [Clostridiales bacterium]
MKLIRNKKFIALFVGLTLITVLLIHGLSFTLADVNDYSQTFLNPYGAAYDRSMTVGNTLTTPNISNAFNWVNGDDAIVELNWTQGMGTATVKGLKPGVSTVVAGSTRGQVVKMNYQVVDPTNITSYTLAGGVEGSVAKGATLNIPISTVPEAGVNKISWVSLNQAVASVSSGVISAKNTDGAAIILGTFSDPWGIQHDIPFLVVVGKGSGGGGGELIKGPDNNWYRPVGRPPHVFEKVDENGNSKVPPEYVYNPGDNPGDGNDRPAIPGGGGFLVEDPPGSNIWKTVDNDSGNLIDSPALWGGPDGKPGGGDDKTVVKKGNDYWVDMGQNVWRKVDKNNPNGPLGSLTGGGPGKDPSTSGVTEIFDNTANDGKYYVGPLGPDDEGNTYYYGDPKPISDDSLDSTKNGPNGDDVKYYKDDNGNMVTAKPSQPIVEVPTGVGNGNILTPEQSGDTVDWIEIARNGDYSLIMRSDFINLNANNLNNVKFQNMYFGSTSGYMASTVRTKLNDWFNNRSAVESLSASARLRQFTVVNNATSVLGSGSSDSGGLTNGFSKPTATQAGTGDDIAFVLSFGEAANFISKMYNVTAGGGNDPSSALAIANFNKLKAYTPEEYIWLRSAATNGITATELHHQLGRAFQILLDTHTALVYPALWVHSAVFTK